MYCLWYKPTPTDSATLQWRMASGNTVEITEIDVSAGLRRTGYGRRLVNDLLGTIPKDVKRVWAITRATNFIAQQFYERLRFRAVPLRDFYGDGGVDAIMYIRDIGSLA